MSEQKKIEVPDSVRVKCPLIGGRLREMPKCVNCEHYRGFNEQIGNPKMAVYKRFMVSCAYPTDRQLFELEATP